MRPARPATLVLALGLLRCVVAGPLPAAAQTADPSAAFSREQVFAALTAAYPGWVTGGPDSDEPSLLVDGRRFVWADGRLLPPDAAFKAPSLAPQPFYPYGAAPPPVLDWTADEVARAEARLADRRAAAVRRDSTFFDTVWSVRDRASADAAQRRVRFLGHAVTVHRSLVGALARLETRLTGERAADPALDRFLKGLAGLDGYNWRDIAETQSRSNHAYGAALDLVPASFGGRNPYWLWAPQGKPGWYRTAWKARWEPPAALVRAFEDEGFVWGGKWLLFDTIHFEYRPEILYLNGLR